MSTVIRQPQLEQIEDENVQQAFQWLLDYLKVQQLLLGQFRLIDFTFTKTGVVNIPHNLGFVPLDIIQTYKVGDATIEYNYASFDKVNLNITVSMGATSETRVRFLAGRI